MTAAHGATHAHEAVMLTSPDRMPLQSATMSYTPVRYLTQKIVVTPAEPAASVVVTAVRPTSSMASGVSIASTDPGLNPYLHSTPHDTLLILFARQLICRSQIHPGLACCKHKDIGAEDARASISIVMNTEVCIPSYPKKECSKADEGSRMGTESVSDGHLAVCIITAHTWTKNCSSNEANEPTKIVHNQATSKVNNSHTKERFLRSMLRASQMATRPCTRTKYDCFQEAGHYYPGVLHPLLGDTQMHVQ
jgi:hypothetical protein